MKKVLLALSTVLLFSSLLMAQDAQSGGKPNPQTQAIEWLNWFTTQEYNVYLEYRYDAMSLRTNLDALYRANYGDIQKVRNQIIVYDRANTLATYLLTNQVSFESVMSKRQMIREISETYTEVRLALYNYDYPGEDFMTRIDQLIRRYERNEDLSMFAVAQPIAYIQYCVEQQIRAIIISPLPITAQTRVEDYYRRETANMTQCMNQIRSMIRNGTWEQEKQRNADRIEAIKADVQRKVDLLANHPNADMGPAVGSINMSGVAIYEELLRLIGVTDESLYAAPPPQRNSGAMPAHTAGTNQ